MWRIDPRKWAGDLPAIVVARLLIGASYRVPTLLTLALLASSRISSISQIIARSDIARGWDATAISSSGNCSGNSKTLSR
jgi:hypothetical protein